MKGAGNRKEQAAHLADGLVLLTGASKQQVRKTMIILAMAGKANERLNLMEARLREFDTVVRCLGTPRWTYRKKGGEKVVSGVRMIHQAGVESCPFCGEKKEGQKRLRPYINKKRRDAALMAVDAQKRYTELTAQISVFKQAVEEVTAVIGMELEQVSEILEGVSDDV